MTQSRSICMFAICFVGFTNLELSAGCVAQVLSREWERQPDSFLVLAASPLHSLHPILPQKGQALTLEQAAALAAVI